MEMFKVRVPFYTCDFTTLEQHLPPGASADELFAAMHQQLVNAIGHDEYARKLARRSGMFEALGDRLGGYHTSLSPIEKARFLWHEHFPQRHRFRLLSALMGDVFGKDEAHEVFTSLWHATFANEEQAVVPCSEAETSLPKTWNEMAIVTDLRRLAGSPSVLANYVDRLRERFFLRQETRASKVRIEWLAMRLAEVQMSAKTHSESFNLAIQRREHELRAKVLALEIRQADESLALQDHLQSARIELEHLKIEAEKAKLRKLIREQEPSLTEPERKPNPEHQRRLKRIEIEDERRDLARRKEEALRQVTETDERARLENIFYQRDEELLNQLGRYL